MSGGKWDYASDIFWSVAHSIEEIILATDGSTDGYGAKYYAEVFSPLSYSEEVIAELKKAVTYMKLAAIYERRIDWLLSGDDGEQTFLTRLKNDLNAERLTGNG